MNRWYGTQYVKHVTGGFKGKFSFAEKIFHTEQKSAFSIVISPSMTMNQDLKFYKKIKKVMKPSDSGNM